MKQLAGTVHKIMKIQRRIINLHLKIDNSFVNGCQYNCLNTTHIDRMDGKIIAFSFLYVTFIR